MRSRRRTAWLAALCALLWQPAMAGDRVDPATLAGKMVMGYQGWFACPGDGTGLGWRHWGEWAREPGPVVDMLPDVAELPPAERCATGMRDAAGQPVDVFDSQDPATVGRHFAWMQQYGLDGVALERFAEALLRPAAAKAADVVLANVRRAAEQHGRVFFVMYDLSGLPPARLPAVVQDWQRLERDGLTQSPAYQRHRGHPVLGLWGLGFRGRPLAPADAAALLDGLARASGPAGGVTFLGGVPSGWRTRDHDASPDPGWDRVWRRLGVLSPWPVGRFGDAAGADAYRRAVLEPDIAAARALGIDYMPVVFPGYSRANAARIDHPAAHLAANSAPRRCGRFYWRQVRNALGAGASMLYGAMFDEVNEGTAMFKLLAQARQVPVQGVVPQARFVTLDADGCRLPDDWYLRLAGAATAALRSGAKPSADLPFPLPP